MREEKQLVIFREEILQKKTMDGKIKE